MGPKDADGMADSVDSDLSETDQLICWWSIDLPVIH